MSRLWSKKFIVVMTTLLAGFILAFAGKLSADFAMITSICVGAYMAAQGAVDYKNGNGKEPPAP